MFGLDGELLGELVVNPDGSRTFTDWYWLNALPVARHVRVLDTAGTQVSDTRTYLHPDHLGTPRLATNTSRQVIWRLDTDPFGDGAVTEDPDGNGVLEVMPLRFPGQYYDTEAGVAYNYFRDYDQGTGRYTQADPIGLKGGINTYAYARGSPLTYTDPDGLHPLLRGAAAAAKKARDALRDTSFDGPRPSRTKPGEGMVCQVRYKWKPVFRIDVHPLDPVDRTPVPHWHIAPDMERHREMPGFVGDFMKYILGGGD